LYETLRLTECFPVNGALKLAVCAQALVNMQCKRQCIQ